MCPGASRRQRTLNGAVEWYCEQQHHVKARLHDVPPFAVEIREWLQAELENP